ncbi:MAG: urease accessory protein UreE [Neomegalonema sp.]|nr:urease accessory protein UreE [Neomegalonema sp.]
MTLPRAIERHAADDWSGDAADAVTLDYDARFRRRRTMRSDGGLAFLLDLPEATELRDGDGLRLEDDRMIVVRAAPEAVADLEARDPLHLVKLAWHLGNRHLPTQIFPDRLRIRQDHVVEAMAQGLGAQVTRLDAPFDPEGGAYGQGRTHGHTHGGGPTHGGGHTHEPHHDH